MDNPATGLGAWAASAVTALCLGAPRRSRAERQPGSSFRARVQPRCRVGRTRTLTALPALALPPHLGTAEGARGPCNVAPRL